MNARHYNILVNAYLANPTTENRDNLREAIIDAPWGANGASFVTHRSEWPHGGGEYRSLYINNRLRVVVSEGPYCPSLDRVLSPQEGEQEYQDRKKRQRKAQDLHDKERRALVVDLAVYGVQSPQTFGEWSYQDGCEGGTFCRSGGVSVGAPGALQEARGSLLESTLERKWDRTLYGSRF